MFRFLSRCLCLAALLMFAPGAGADWVPLPNDTVWHTYSLIYNKSGPIITAMRATWTVPQLPAVMGRQYLAIWPGLETEDSLTILQPVLEWGLKNNEGSKSWGLSCWGVKINGKGQMNNVRTKSSFVVPGTEVTGVMELVSRASGVYRYKCYFEGYPASALDFELKEPLNSAWVEYETHNITDCDQYTVGPVEFRNVLVKTNGRPLRLKWYRGRQGITDPKRCGMKVRVLKDSQADGRIAIGIDAK